MPEPCNFKPGNVFLLDSELVWKMRNDSLQLHLNFWDRTTWCQKSLESMNLFYLLRYNFPVLQIAICSFLMLWTFIVFLQVHFIRVRNFIAFYKALGHLVLGKGRNFSQVGWCITLKIMITGFYWIASVKEFLMWSKWVSKRSHGVLRPHNISCHHIVIFFFQQYPKGKYRTS